MIDTADRIVFFGGAGVSTESGIPDFRSENGLYKAKLEYGHRPEEMVSHSFLINHPDIFFKYYKENLVYPDTKPNAAHYGIAKLEESGKDVQIVTQNVDGLHQVAGSSTVWELHGNVNRNYCTSCGAKYDLAYILDPANCRKDGSDTEYVPWCKCCGGLVRPDVVLYGENLDDDVVAEAAEAIRRTNLLIIGGTSLSVYPAAGYLNFFRGDNLVQINLTSTGAELYTNLSIQRPIGEVFSELQ
jgi:NAD-dependent deacetylase